MSIEDTDKAAAAIAKAPRVRLADIEAAIAHRFFTSGLGLMMIARPENRFTDPDVPLVPLETMTICMLVMRNGFVVIGKSMPASSENFSEALGQRFAYEDAIRQLWPLMGYALRDKLSQEKADEPPQL